MNFTHSIIARLPSTTILYKSCSPGSLTVERSFAKKVVRSWPSSTLHWPMAISVTSREFHFHLFTEAAPLKHLLLSTSLYSNDFSPNLRCQDSDHSPEKGEGIAISSLTSEEAGLPRL